ncbi:hypothetical protein [Cupriavidus pinatubonensis]|uniref:hypothetical protein n=1 Tax=Cupriavidus pinatubonensis TaxID=248026 RepID=UPI00112A5D3B|nr:hypothetical protein [Cupriavidus pinatubonensis]TPQ35713.1 hypothetical protein C2U69_20465 [Cupriavidus pinatubonensis]
MPTDHDAAAVAFDRLVRECLAGVPMLSRRPGSGRYPRDRDERLAADRERKSAERAAESPEERAARLASQRAYVARRQAKPAPAAM